MSASVGTTLKSPASTTGASRRIKLGRVRQEPLHPSELVFEFRSRLRVAVRRIERRYQHAIDGCLDIAALGVGRIAGQLGACDDRFTIARENRDAIPRFLPAPDGAITGLFNCPDRKFGICSLQLLKTYDIRPRRSNQSRRLASRLLTLLMLKVAIFIEVPSRESARFARVSATQDCIRHPEKSPGFAGS